jgi:hypothetical protein
VDGGQLYNRVESLIVVDAGPLGEAVKKDDRIELVLEDPFADEDIGVNRTRDKIPSVVGDQSIIFFLHGTTLGWVSEGGGGHRRER